MNVTVRGYGAAQRQPERESKKRQRELERIAKEMAKRDALERARHEVETYENSLDVLLSVHKEQSDERNWTALAASLPPVKPQRMSHNELRVRRKMIIVTDLSAENEQHAVRLDDDACATALKKYEDDYDDWAKSSVVARRIVAGDTSAYIDAIQALNPFDELDGIGSSLSFTVHSHEIIECSICTNGRRAIPTEIKTLTAAGKLSVKPLPKARFIELYQDYVCGCVLRVARELFALLPVKTVIIHALAETLDTGSGHMVEQPFLSVAISRENMMALNFELLDPSDAIMGMLHRGDLKASRSTGDFKPVNLLTLADLPGIETSTNPSHISVIESIRRLRADIGMTSASLLTRIGDVALNGGET